MNATFEEICSPKMAMLILKSPRATLMESESSDCVLSIFGTTIVGVPQGGCHRPKAGGRHFGLLLDIFTHSAMEPNFN